MEDILKFIVENKIGLKYDDESGYLIIYTNIIHEMILDDTI
jgi:hypothetical protein